MDSSIIADRRLLRRRLGFWRLAAVVLLVALGFALYSFAFSESSTARPHIAHVTISGLITDDDELLERLKKIKDNDQVKAVVVSISSPGGTTYGGEKIFKAIRAIAEKKPVVSDVRTLAASAGYMQLRRNSSPGRSRRAFPSSRPILPARSTIARSITRRSRSCF